jgi:micrococcal nuclease
LDLNETYRSRKTVVNAGGLFFRWRWYFPASILLVLLFVLLKSPYLIGLTDDDPRLVKRVVDSDTILMGNGERVRLIGVAPPVTKPPDKNLDRLGMEATAFARKIAQGKRVRLELDPANAPTEHKDRGGRTLAYVFLPDGTLLNAAIIREGYGSALGRFPFARLEEFRRLERQAEAEGRGLWPTK